MTTSADNPAGAVVGASRSHATDSDHAARSAPEGGASPRELALLRTFRAAFAALDGLRVKEPDAAARVADTIAAHLRSGYPTARLGTAPWQDAPLIRPESTVIRELGPRHWYELARRDGGTLGLYVHEGDAHDAHVDVSGDVLLADVRAAMEAR